MNLVHFKRHRTPLVDGYQLIASCETFNYRTQTDFLSSLKFRLLESAARGACPPPFAPASASRHHCLGPVRVPAGAVMKILNCRVSKSQFIVCLLFRFERVLGSRSHFGFTSTTTVHTRRWLCVASYNTSPGTTVMPHLYYRSITKVTCTSSTQHFYTRCSVKSKKTPSFVTS